MDSVKSLVAYLKRSGLVSQLSTSVIQDIETRWNSKLAMLISVYEVFEEIQSILKEKNQNQKLQFIDVVLMKNLITLLAPFKSVSTAMEGDKYLGYFYVAWGTSLEKKAADSLARKI